MQKIIDNKIHGTVIEELKNSIEKSSKLSVISGLFSIWAFAELQTELEKVEDLRLIIPDYWNKKESFLNDLLGSIGDRKFRNNLNTSQIAKECSNWLEKKAQIKTSENPIPQNLFCVDNNSNHTAIQGSSDFTAEGLGFVPSKSFHMNACFDSASETKALLQWFDNMWNSKMGISDLKNELMHCLEIIYSDKSPQLIYYLILYNIFKDFLGEIEEEKIIKTKTGIKDTIIWNKLYKFQKDGVLGAIDKIEKYNGCIIADSVGLGKTFEALAIIKYYELRNDRTLVLCPKKLRENWTLYTINDTRNLLAEDRFNYDVLNHTDLTRISGYSGEINLKTINWSNYDLIVIDESHNFRNNSPRKDGVTRYSKLMKDIIRSGVKTKVLMLSATPVNSRMNDLKNQIAFITEGKDDSFYNNGVSSIEQTLKNAQAKFNSWLKLDEKHRTTESLLETLNFGYFKLLDMLTIARSRKHILKYYDIKEIGKFPERLTPINIKTDIDLDKTFPQLKEINRSIRRLNLSAYAPLKYVLTSKMEEYSRKYDMQVAGGSVFRQIDREQNLIHLMRVNLLKRMESSIYSFSQTLEKLLFNVQSIIEKIDAHEEMEVEELNIENIEIEDEDLDPFVIGRKVKVLIQDVDKIRWKQELREDEDLLVQMLRASKLVTATKDAKLFKLKSLIEQKYKYPLNINNKKIIIFTAFADTANYLYSNLSDWAKDNLGLYSAIVTGAGDNKTTMPNIKKDLASIITSFSPISKERDKIDSNLQDQIDILIATDCISEGQNLQDCDYLVNYDIHWNPVRIIQRFGRIDRLGSKNNVIQLVNFWPNMELDEYINLEARVSGRMVLLDISATGEENVIEFTDAGKMNDLTYRRKQLERLQKEVVDIEDISGGISITDLTLNDFRMDLGEYLKNNTEYIESMPLGIHGIVLPDALTGIEVNSGAIFCLKCVNSKIQPDSNYSLAPYYIVFVSDSGEVILNFNQSKKILDILRKATLGYSAPDIAAIDMFNKNTNNGSNMSEYKKLLSKAVYAITGKAEEQGIESLFQKGGTSISSDSFGCLNDFEVVAYLIIAKK